MNFPGETEVEQYKIAKRTLVVGLRKTLKFDQSKLEMDMEKRKKKWGRWRQNKYVYPDEQQNALREFITERIFEHFPEAGIDYFT